MQKLSTLCLAVFALLISAQFASAQILLQEDFNDGGIPAGWTTTDASGQNILWEWCAGPAAGCVELYGNDPFASTTAANGFMVLNSDGSGQALPTAHISRLTTPAINCSAANQVFVTFENYLGVFNTPSTGSALLKVSTNGTTWTSFNAVPGLADDQVSENIVKAQFDISSVAANKATVYLQWEWTANYDYWWMIDDVVVTSQNPTPANNLVIGDFFYPPSSYATPVSQIASDTFGFYAFVSNPGTEDQHNVTLIAQVLKVMGNTVLYSDSITIGTLPAGYVDSAIELSGRFIPDNLAVGVYRVSYTVHSDVVDQVPQNNTQFDNFEVTDLIFSKENGPTGGLRPGGPTPTDYAVANYYRMDPNNQDKYKAVGLQFSCSTNTGDLPIGKVSVSAFLFKLNDAIDDNFTGFDQADFISASFDWLGLASYDMPDNAAQYQMQDVELADLSGTPGIPLDPGGRYFVAIQYSDSSNVAFQSFNDRTKHFFVSTAVYTDHWYLGGFGQDQNAVIRLFLELLTTSDQEPLAETALQVMPNPISDGMLNLAVEFAQPTNASITIADLNGRVIDIDERQGLTKETLHYNVPELANGTYLARIATAEGTRTVKFVVAH